MNFVYKTTGPAASGMIQGPSLPQGLNNSLTTNTLSGDVYRTIGDPVATGAFSGSRAPMNLIWRNGGETGRTETRDDVDLKYSTDYGKAVVVLRMFRMAETPVTLLLTTRCDIDCKACFAPKPKPPVELDVEMIKKTIEELRGLEKLYFSGGEPFRHSQIMEIVNYAAARVKRLYIDTNGRFLKQELPEAIEQLKEFPKNVTFILSLDTNHSEAMERTGRSLGDIYRTLREACLQTGLGLEFNVRTPPSSDRQHGAYREALKAVGKENDGDSRLFDDFHEKILGNVVYYKNSIHANALLAEGGAAGLSPKGAKRIGLNDFLEHVSNIKDIGLFIDQRGRVISGDHAAFLENPPAFAVWGDLRQATLAKLLFDIFIKRASKDPSIEPTGEQILQLIADPAAVPINWEINDAQFQRLFLALPEERRERLLLSTISAYGQAFLETESFFVLDWYGKLTIDKFKFSSERGKPSIVFLTNSMWGAATPLKSLRGALERTVKQAKYAFGPESAKKYFFEPLISYLEANLNKAKNPLQVKFCIMEIKKYFGERIDLDEESNIVRHVDPDILEEMFRALDEAKQKELILPFAQYCATRLQRLEYRNSIKTISYKTGGALHFLTHFMILYILDGTSERFNPNT